MCANIQLLDCTLRDGAYIVDSKFGAAAIRGIISKLQAANIDIIECGWLKNSLHEGGTTFYHVPQDVEQYMANKNPHAIYTAMIDWDRYDPDYLPPYDGKSIDAIRVVFPKDKFREGIACGKVIKEKGYKLFFQAANTLGYSEDELASLAEEVNAMQPESLSVVDTFGAMYEEDLERIVTILDEKLDKDIKLGFHSHNNQQLSFALSMKFIDMTQSRGRDAVVDSSLCGMGRGAGNTTTELLVHYLCQKYKKNYDINVIMDAIDMYMGYFIDNYKWGYSIPYFISGVYCAHVNNIAYLLSNHRTNAKDMRIIIESLTEEERKKYDYDKLEQVYLDYQNKIVNDEDVLFGLEKVMQDRKVLLISPGRSIIDQKERVLNYIDQHAPIVIGINAISTEYTYDYLFFSNKVRYDYAKEVYPELFNKNQRIVVSGIKTEADSGEHIINFNLLLKRGWRYFDNAVIMCLRLLNKLHVQDIALAGFDGFKEEHSKSYFDASMPVLNNDNNWDEVNSEIRDMFQDFQETMGNDGCIEFITDSIFS